MGAITGPTFNGRFYILDRVQTGPRPFHPIRIWLGAYGPKMLRLTGRLGDGWTPSYGYAPPAQIPKMQQTIDQSLTETAMKFAEFITLPVLFWKATPRKQVSRDP